MVGKAQRAGRTITVAVTLTVQYVRTRCTLKAPDCQRAGGASCAGASGCHFQAQRSMMQPEQAHATRRGVVGRGLLILAKKNLDSFSLWGDMMMMGVVSTGLLHAQLTLHTRRAGTSSCVYLVRFWRALGELRTEIAPAQSSLHWTCGRWDPKIWT